MLKNVWYLSLSWALVCFAQPDISVLASVVSCLCGYGLFWKSLVSLAQHLPWKKIWWIAFFWIWTIEGFHFSWMLEDLYVGTGIYGVWAVLVSSLSVFFASFSSLLVLCFRRQYWYFLLVELCEPLVYESGWLFESGSSCAAYVVRLWHGFGLACGRAMGG